MNELEEGDINQKTIHKRDRERKQGNERDNE